MSTDTTRDQHRPHKPVLEPWQSWESTARYLIVRLSQVVPNAVLVWQAWLRH